MFGTLAFLRNILRGESARLARSVLESPCKFGDHILRIMLDVAAERKVLKYTKKGRERRARASAVRGCLGERIPLTCARTGAGVAAPGGGGACRLQRQGSGAGLEMTKGKKLYTKSSCIVRDECGQIHLRPGSIKHGNTGGEKTYTHFI